MRQSRELGVGRTPAGCRGEGPTLATLETYQSPTAIPRTQLQRAEGATSPRRAEDEGTKEAIPVDVITAHIHSPFHEIDPGP